MRWREISAAALAIGRSSMPRSKFAPAPTINSAATPPCGAARSRRSTTRPIFLSAMKRRSLPHRRSEASLAQLYARHPDATIVAGTTDVGLWITKKLMPIEKIIHVGRVSELSKIEETEDGWAFGAIVSLARAMPVLGTIDPDIAEVLRRFGSIQVRASGTVGGSIANASPIGDLAPLADCARRRYRAASRDDIRRAAAGKLLSRLRQAGSRQRRIRPPAVCAEFACRQPISAPTKSPNASTRIFPRCWRCSA